MSSSKNDLTERALDSLDELARDWAAQIGLSIMVANVRSSQDGVYALALQAFIEGAYRGRTSPRSAPETHCTHCGGTGFDGDEPCEFCAASGRADETNAGIEKARVAMACIYQVLGALGDIAGHFDTEDVQDVLDVASRWESMTVKEIEALLPWPSKELAKQLETGEKHG